MIHFTGDNDNILQTFSGHIPSTPYSPEPGWILYVGEAGSPSSSGDVLPELFRAIGLKAEQFLVSEKGISRTGAVEADGEWYLS